MSSDREPYLKLIEREPIIDGKYINASRIGPTGGNGHFSLVFSAEDRSTGNKVALKFFDPQHLIDEPRIRRFHNEAELLKKLIDNERVIDIYGDIAILKKLLQSDTGVPVPVNLYFYAMPLADNNVEEIINTGRLSIENKLLLFKEIIKAVSSVHRCKITHRDLKPGNFLIVNNNIVLADMGCGKYLDGIDVSKEYSYWVGDSKYTAPEHLCAIGIGDYHSYSADIYSLGSILFEIFTSNILQQQIFQIDDLKMIAQGRQLIKQQKQSDKKEVYFELISILESKTKLPNIFDFNNDIPGSIKYHLNELYLGMVAIDYRKRMNNYIYMHRKLDICLKILRNEEIYKKWRLRKANRYKAREDK